MHAHLGHAHDPALAVLSVLLAVAGAFTAFDIGDRLAAAEGRRSWTWLMATAIAMGGGLWSMHFVAMLAMDVPVPVGYDLPLTVASLAAAIVFTGVGFLMVRDGRTSLGRVAAAGLFVGLGIACMNYLGMAAMHMPVRIEYHRGLVAASVAIAVLAASLALHLAWRTGTRWQKLSGAVAIGAAVSGMHFSGMAAAEFIPVESGSLPDNRHDIGKETLALLVAVATVAVHAVALVSAAIDRRLARLAQRETAALQRFRALVQNSSDIIVLFDRDGNLVYASPSAMQASGLSMHDILAGDYLRLIDADERIRLLGVLQCLRHRAGASVRGSFSLHRRDGSRRRFEMIATNMHDDPAVAALVMNLRDVTEQAETTSALLAAKEEAELANRSKSQFLATMSHELRTPLNAIIGFSELMEQELLGPVGNDHYRGYVRDIGESGRLLLHVIDDILDIARIENGAVKLTEDTVAVGNLVEGVLRLVRVRASESETTLEVDLPDGLPDVVVDQSKMKQVLLNLLSNALKFGAGGPVGVSGAVRSDGGVTLSVADRGIGMTADEIHQAFRAFVQVDASLARRHQGIGLGLPIARSLTELHGGRLRLAGAPGEGITATVELPPERTVPAARRARMAAGR